MTVKEIARYAKIKGLQVLGTGDFTHPMWLKEIRETLTQNGDSGLFKVVNDPQLTVNFMLTTEVCTIFDYKGKNRKVHHVIFAPSLDNVEQINEVLAKYGNLRSDGRPILSLSAPQLVEEVMQISTENVVIPAHAWTPWFGVFGSFSGFDSIDDCYQDMTRYIHALETGLSSDPPMNWRLSDLDRFTLVSNSDCHSFWPWRMGREANVFNLEQGSYKEITDAIQTKDVHRFVFTVETDPAYGKYHWSGHRNCNISMSAEDARKHNDVCPVCGKKLTEGVEQRVEELADRSPSFKVAGSPGFMRLMPLHEIIAAVIGSASPSTQAVWKIYNPLISKFGDEYSVLIDAPRDSLADTVDPMVADAIVKVREGKVRVIPGYDGVYGKLVLSSADKEETSKTQSSDSTQLKYPRVRLGQSSLGEFI
jgi:uncharacterized protein (TIGR00375 family)